MKNTIVTAVLVLVALFTCEIGFAQELTLDKEVHDYGTIKQGANGECVFVVKNTGSAPLIISNCKGSCGCTVPQCDKAPIAPGGTQEIKVKYDTKRVGPINKSVTITSNATNTPTKMIRIKGNVLAKEPIAPAK
ncbi:MAG TPA: hypothetical protein DCF89_04775 [Flavobacteriales bacterium]|jgi:hypothetical protein|nr:hypothetical protein [Flavobacteriales bacterium]